MPTDPPPPWPWEWVPWTIPGIGPGWCISWSICCSWARNSIRKWVDIPSSCPPTPDSATPTPRTITLITSFPYPTRHSRRGWTVFPSFSSHPCFRRNIRRRRSTQCNRSIPRTWKTIIGASGRCSEAFIPKPIPSTAFPPEIRKPCGGWGGRNCWSFTGRTIPATGWPWPLSATGGWMNWSPWCAGGSGRFPTAIRAAPAIPANTCRASRLCGCCR